MTNKNEYPNLKSHTEVDELSTCKHLTAMLLLDEELYEKAERN